MKKRIFNTFQLTWFSKTILYYAVIKSYMTYNYISKCSTIQGRYNKIMGKKHVSYIKRSTKEAYEGSLLPQPQGGLFRWLPHSESFMFKVNFAHIY